jgi:tagaturonate reductase
MELLSKKITKAKERPIRVLQFGEGNFLRGFVDYMIDVANEKGVFDGNIVVVKPITFGNLKMFHDQDCQYTLQLRGRVDGEPQVITRVITSIADAVDAYEEYEKYRSFSELDTLRFVVSNTTEAGIVFDETDKLSDNPPKSYPGKLTKFLFERYTFFKGALDKGLVILPVELIDDNGIELEKCVKMFASLWELPEEFVKWLDEACAFTSTLVDRIITGYPRDEVEQIWSELGYQDNLLNTGEPFALWVIESSKDISKEFPLPEAGMPVVFTDNQKPYKQRKVRILNGAHTSFVLASYLAGNDFVAESMNDELISKFMLDTIYEEVIPTLSLPKEDLEAFASAVIDRFNNPFIKHSLLAISLNSVSKWRARCLPSFLGYYEKEHKLPKHLTFSIASLLAFYDSATLDQGILIGTRNGESYEIKDDQDVLIFFRDHAGSSSEDLARAYLSMEAFHGMKLTEIEGLCEQVSKDLHMIREHGMRTAIERTFS